MSSKLRCPRIVWYAFLTVAIGLAFIGVWKGVVAIAHWGEWEPIVVTVHCDGERIIEVTPPGKLNSYYPTLQSSGKSSRGVSWYDGTNAKHWVDVSHCGSIQIKPWKTIPVKQ